MIDQAFAIAELSRVKVLFQQRAIAAIVRGPFATTDDDTFPDPAEEQVGPPVEG